MEKGENPKPRPPLPLFSPFLAQPRREASREGLWGEDGTRLSLRVSRRSQAVSLFSCRSCRYLLQTSRSGDEEGLAVLFWKLKTSRRMRGQG